MNGYGNGGRGGRGACGKKRLYDGKGPHRPVRPVGK